MYIQIAIHDYLRCLMLMHAKDTAFTLDPRVSFPEHNNKTGLQRGEGNMVSVEFNLLYRFHSPISKREAWWTEDMFVQLLQDRNMVVETKAEENMKTKFTKETIVDGEIPFPIFRHMIDGMKNASKVRRDRLAYFPAGLDPVGGWKEKDDQGRRVDGPETFRFKRGKDGKFDDAQLAAELMRVMEDPISSFGANNVPRVLKGIEIMGMLQARQWEVATLNEFRQFFNMSRHTHFEDINSDPKIQEKLRDLYKDPDLVELYPGLFCEGESQCLDPGTSCPNKQSTALWRAVFSDAVTLVRSDRFYTLDWNVGSLTAWGMKEVTSDPNVNKGSVMHRLFQRALPGFFNYNSLHMWQPFYTPTMNVQLAQEQGYLSFLDLNGLEDENGAPWDIKMKNGKVLTDFKRLCQVDKNGKGRQVRKCLKLDLPTRWLDKNWVMQTTKATRIGCGKHEYPWRGGEKAYMANVLIEINDYEVIRDSLFAEGESINFANPSILSADDIPGQVLSAIMTKQWNKWESAFRIVWGGLGPDWEETFMNYFVEVSQEIRLREQRTFQKCPNGDQVFQIDIVSDYAIPVVTRFIADFLGFWTEVKTPQFLDRPYSENQIYRLLENCQNYDSYDADPTKTWARRMAYRESIKTLKGLTELGIRKYEPYLFEHGFLGIGSRSYGFDGDSKQVRTIRKIAVGIVRGLTTANFTHEEIVAVMLSTALDAAQKTVVTFTEAMAYFIDPRQDLGGEEHVIDAHDERTKLWGQLQALAWQDAKKLPNGSLQFKNDPEIDEKILGYVLEAQRFNPYMRVPRVCNPVGNGNDLVLANGLTVKRGKTLLVNMYAAYKNLPQDYEDFPHSHKFDPTRETASYLIYGGDGKIFTRRLALIAITGMVKHTAHLKELRVAHDKIGRLKRVQTPRGNWYYATVQWDNLVSSPITWNLRFNGVGKGVWEQGDNADQGHGQNQVVIVPKAPAKAGQDFGTNGYASANGRREAKPGDYVKTSARELSQVSL
ncbi:uncharacterized protein B0I36DRAFT_309597 [Microdochium trichocladiopsis]|uniref:Heme peroxidase n=1 Tax=Microdochium trichocladiopsis TaxID=1682393 RepID=A0A9P9BV35_9PEZI|nr:uncharacterized protein B0I36DRAFT_309597 [Microdochium trichocladiopsis]KAH7039913.1 hypothetical protein B0I36DRAFT_309597 [Microdochium trichocladiopsis]